MKLSVNRDLLPLKIHYFFKYGGLSFFTLLPVVARQKGIPEVAVGLMWSVTPSASCAINLLTSSIADKYKIYRAMFLGATLVLSVSFLSVFLLPNISPTPDTLPATVPQSSRHCYHTNVSSSLALCSLGAPDLPVLWNCVESSGEGNVTEGGGRCTLQCSFSQESNQTFLFPDMHLNFSAGSGRYHVCESGQCTVITTSSASLCGSEHNSASCQYQCEASSASLVEVIGTVQFWVMFVLLLLVYGSNATTTTLADTICFQLLGKDRRHLYGRQRMFGSIGWGLAGATCGALVDYYSKGKDQVDYTPVVLVAGFFFLCNLAATFRIHFNVHDREKLKASRIGRALCSFPVLLYLLSVLFGGFNIGLVFTFIFIVVEDVAGPSFSNLKLLQGLMLGTSCFIGEVPSLFFSSMVIKRVGNIVTFVISMSAMTVRVFLYSTVTNPWFFIPIDLLHGPSFGLFYPNMIAAGSKLAPHGAQATMQSIVKTTFIIGSSLGALAGGVMVTAVGGSNTYFYLGVFDTGFVVLYCLVQYLLYRSRPRADTAELGDYQPPGIAECVPPELHRSVCDLQVCTPCPDLPEADHSDEKQ